MGSIPLERFELASETGVHAIDAVPRRRRGRGLRLLYVGRLIRSKGLRDAIRALGLVDSGSGVSLDIAGDGEDRAECEKLVRRLQLDDRVTFHGRLPRAEVDALYRSADAFIFPSFREPSGNVVFEAMRFGLPVITTDVGGPGHVVDEEAGFCLPAVNPLQLASDLARAISQMSADHDMLQRMSHGAVRRLASWGLWDDKITWMYSLYRDVLRSQTRPPRTRRNTE
jgi:glycosyltransferase involved in cell wall biosynthesis